jgi:HEPN domain-containing protein
MMTKKDIETLADIRLGDATHLYQASRYSAAYYLAGYAVELGIKACIATHFQARTIPDKTFVNEIYSHRLNELLGHAGLQQHLQKDMANDALLSLNWGVASKWKETSRYEIWDPFAAAGMIEAVGEQNHGVLQWLKKHW